MGKRIQLESGKLYGEQLGARYQENDGADEDDDLVSGIYGKMLMNTLAHVRHLSSFTLVEYNELETLEEEIQTSVEANDKHEKCEMGCMHD